MEKQVKSKKRVSEHGEVYTAKREVNAMLDLVKDETERIDSRFLEPACGNGNFLEEILNRKLAVVKRKYKKSAADYEKNAILALTSIYGIDLLEDNVSECRERLFGIWDKEYSAVCKKEACDECRNAARYILEKNILCGDALTLLKNDGTPITFAEWSFVTGSMIKRRDFELAQLVNDTPVGDVRDDQLSLLDDSSKSYDRIAFDKETQTNIALPVKEYEIMHYRRIAENG